MNDLREGIDALRTALGIGRDLIPTDLRTEISTVLDQVESRLGHLGPTVVVALAGGTGSGKSSLFNALAGARVAEPGVLRPTTQRPVALIDDDAENGLLLLLADLGIDDIRRGSSKDLALIDLPDIDSVQKEHRALVDLIVPRVDAVIWVLDPTKYNDALVHDDYLRPLRAYEEQFLIVMNQMDRLTEDEQRDVLEDLQATLDRDGFGSLPVLGVAADPPGGQPIGIDALHAQIEARFQAKQAAQGRIQVTVEGLSDQLRVVAGQPSDLPDRDGVFDQAAQQLGTGVIDEPAIGRAGDIGAANAHRIAWGPFGILATAVRGSVVGRAIGLRPDELLDGRVLPSTSRPISRLAPAILLQDWTIDVALALGEPLGRQVRATVGDLDEVVQRATGEARKRVDGALTVPQRPWWLLAGFVRTLAVLAVVGVALALWSDPSRMAPGQLPVPIVILVVAIVAILGLGRVARASGRSVGEATAREQRSLVVAAARESLDFHVGRPVDDVLRVRRDLRQALPPAGPMWRT